MELIEQTREYVDKRESIINDLAKALPKFLGDSDRSVVLVGVTRLENELEKYLTSFMIESPTGIEDLFGSGPLSTFSSKISVARRLGLINNELQDAIDAMRKIRNLVNKPEENDVFESVDVPRIINNMHTKYCENKNFIEIQNAVSQSEKFQSLKKSNEVKADFILVLFYLLYTLQTGKLLAQKKQYRAKLILSFP